MKKPHLTPKLPVATLLAASLLLPSTPIAASAILSGDQLTRPTLQQSARTTLSIPQLRQYSGRGAGPDTTIDEHTAASTTTPKPECPPELMRRCHFVPAAYKQNNPADKSDYGNYDTASRPTDSLTINSIVVHDTEGSLADTFAVFQNPTYYASAHYVIDSDGSIYQMVQNKDIAWHAGNWYVNLHSIGIEHVGRSTDPSTYTSAMYRSSALLVRYLADKYHIPVDRDHILGHDNVTAPTPGLVASMHTDPGPFWNWQHYMTLLGAPVHPTTGPDSDRITNSPRWQLDKTVVSTCQGSTCTDLPKQSTNFLYLHTTPDTSSPLVTDAVLSSGGTPGTTRINDISARAVYGQSFAVANRQGSWTAIWFGGQKAWFLDGPGLLGASPTRGQYITPRSGLATIPVYGRAYPEITAYADTSVPKQAITPLQYTIPAGQRYATIGFVPTDYYWAWNIDASLPDDHTVIIGTERYYQIQFNGRIAYVKQADVELHSAD